MENTFEYNRQLSDSDKQAILKEAKGGSWYDGWAPFHVLPQPMSQSGCSSPRMIPQDYGFICPDCGLGSEIGFNLEAITDRKQCK